MKDRRFDDPKLLTERNPSATNGCAGLQVTHTVSTKVRDRDRLLKSFEITESIKRDAPAWAGTRELQED